MPVFLVDGNLPRQLVKQAREHGHEERWVRTVMPGAGDREILNELTRSE
jgi:predicted nuclease of predicted toxin-antitoxin system